MKRGLVELDAAVPPAGERAARMDALRVQMRQAGATTALVYGDVARSDDIAYLTNLSIYWNQGILAVPAEGEPAFLTKLSKRVHPWMRSTSTLQDLRSGGDLGALVGEFVGSAAPRIGIVDRHLWPVELVRGVEAACPGAEIFELPDAVRRPRTVLSPSEAALMRDAGQTLAAALDGVTRLPALEAVASVERALRRAGSTDVLVSRDESGDGTVTVDATVQYRTLWVRAARAGGGALGRAVNDGLAAAVAGLRAGARPSDLCAAAHELLEPDVDARVACTNHADLATGGELRIPGPDSDVPLAAGEAVVVALESWPGAGHVAAAGTYLVSESGAESLTDPPHDVPAQLGARAPRRRGGRDDVSPSGVPTGELDRRHRRLRAAMAEQGFDGLLAFAPAWRRENVRYLTGAPLRSALAFAYFPHDGNTTVFVTGPTDRAASSAADVRPFGLADIGELVARLREDVSGGGAVGVAHAELVPEVLSQALTRALPNVRFGSATALMERVRLVKGEWELAQIRRAAELCDTGWQAFIEALRPGIAEHEIVAEVEAALKAAGAEDNFMIIASGGDDVRGMTPPSSRRLEPGDMVRTELTPQLNGYWAQICRSAVLGIPSAAQRESFELFNEALQAGLDAIRAGVTAHDVAKAENDVFRGRGYGEYCTSEYTRVRGHGHGLHLDEVPIVEGVDTVLHENAVLIVHPNTYTPIAGYHVLGDPAVVTSSGCEVLVSAGRELVGAGA